ncbi:MAG TPA: hypothetical protein VFY23_02390 [Candidatus Limnocylindrales bacterium]|nr:hypothetical protein [Candidatus Limnocylindrales bacterium]
MRRAVMLAGALTVALVAAGCGGSAGATMGAPDPAGTAPSPLRPGGSTNTPTAAPGEPSLTPVPGGQSTIPDDAPSRIPTTQTDWGTILDALPASFPLYPGAGIAEVPEGPLSGSFDAQDDVKTVVAWYEDQLAARGYGLERSDPLEDGSITLDGQADLPECRIRMVFRPEARSTIIAVLVASACVTGTEG